MLEALREPNFRLRDRKKNISTDGITTVSWSPIAISKKKSILKRLPRMRSSSKSISVSNEFERVETVDGVVMRCYDFGGQQVFYPTHEFFLSSRSIYVAVFNAMQFDSVRLEYWMKKISVFGNRSTPVFVVGTHAESKTFTEQHSNKVEMEVKTILDKFD